MVVRTGQKDAGDQAILLMSLIAVGYRDVDRFPAQFIVEVVELLVGPLVAFRADGVEFDLKTQLRLLQREMRNGEANLQ